MSKYYGRDGIKQILDYLKNELLSRLLDKQDKLTFDNTPTKNSNNPVKSNGIYNSTLTKVTSMPNNPSDGDLIIWNGASPYISGHIYKYVAGSSSTLYAWQVDNPGGIGDGTVIYTKSAIPNEDTNIYKSDGTAYSSFTDDPTYELMVGGESAITIEIFSLSQMQSWERGANRDSSNDITVSSGEWTDISLVSSAYHHAGTKTVAQLTSSLLVAANEGNVYNITDSGITTADFIEGAGKPINEGSNVGIANVGNNTYKFDLLSGVIDDSNLAHTDINETITGYWTFDDVYTNFGTSESINNTTNFYGTTNVYGYSQFGDNENPSSGSTTFYHDVNFDGRVNFNNSIESHYANFGSISSTYGYYFLRLDTDVEINGDLNMDGNDILNVDNLYIDNLNVSTIQNGQSDITMSCDTVIMSNAECLNLDVTGDATISGDLTVSGTITDSTGGTLVYDDDSRLSDARTPSNDSNLVHKTGTENITGAKNFSDIRISGTPALGTNITSSVSFVEISSSGQAPGGGDLVNSCIVIETPVSVRILGTCRGRDLPSSSYHGILIDNLPMAQFPQFFTCTFYNDDHFKTVHLSLEQSSTYSGKYVLKMLDYPEDPYSEMYYSNFFLDIEYYTYAAFD